MNFLFSTIHGRQTGGGGWGGGSQPPLKFRRGGSTPPEFWKGGSTPPDFEISYLAWEFLKVDLFTAKKILKMPIF